MRRRPRLLRAALLTAGLLGFLAMAACGKKGPPSPPGPPDQIIYPRGYPVVPPGQQPPSVSPPAVWFLPRFGGTERAPTTPGPVATPPAGPESTSPVPVIPTPGMVGPIVSSPNAAGAVTP